MKKLLSLISAFNITILSSLTSVSCKEEDSQNQTINNSTEQAETALSVIDEEDEAFFEKADADDWTADETSSVSEETSSESTLTEQVIADENKEDLSTIDNLHLLPLEANTTQTYSLLNNQIIASKVFDSKRVRRGFKIKYYNAQTEGAEITATNQKTGPVWVEIIANRTNQIWKGKTNRIALSFIGPTVKIKKNLNTIIDQISPIKFRANQPYKNLNQQIVNNINEFKTKPLAQGYQIDYYTPGTIYGINSTDSNLPQKIGTVFIKITASANDPSWNGYTNKLTIELKESIQINIDNIRDSLFAPISNSAIKANITQPYTSLNSTITQKLKQLEIFKKNH